MTGLAPTVDRSSRYNVISSVPTATGRFSICWISFPRRPARGTPRRLMPTSVRSSTPLFFSTISWASRTRVRSISEADMMRPFSRKLDRWLVVPLVIFPRMISDAKQMTQKFSRAGLISGQNHRDRSADRSQKQGDGYENNGSGRQHLHQPTIRPEHRLHGFLHARIGIGGRRLIYGVHNGLAARVAIQGTADHRRKGEHHGAHQPQQSP